LLDRAWSIAVRSGEIQRIGPVGTACLEWGWLTGRTAEIRDRVDAAVTLAAQIGHVWYLGELRRYLLLVDGQPAEGQPGAATGGPGPQVDVDLLPEPWRGGIRGAWQDAAARWETLGWPYERALELASSGEADATIAGLHALDGLGAAAAATQVRRRLRELGVRHIPRGPREETRSNPAGLTTRQMEVLRLVAEGATNAQIADRLVVSPRTVDHHVSAVLTKLGVTSRREVATRAVELGLELAPPAPA
jgi:DNA-binding CsgD family transcriptional regulator